MIESRRFLILPKNLMDINASTTSTTTLSKNKLDHINNINQ